MTNKVTCPGKAPARTPRLSDVRPGTLFKFALPVPESIVADRRVYMGAMTSKGYAYISLASGNLYYPAGNKDPEVEIISEPVTITPEGD